MISCASYLRKVLDPSSLTRVTRQIAKVLNNQQFDAIAISGLSGLLVGPVVSVTMKKPLVVVRKDETSHSSYEIETSLPNGVTWNYIILDDLICLGHTVERIISTIGRQFSQTKCVGIVLYHACCINKWVRNSDESFPVFDAT